MTRLPIPVKNALTDKEDEIALERVWRRVQDGPRPRHPLWPRLALLLAPAAIAALALVLLPRLGRSPEPGPLQVVSGHSTSDLDGALAQGDGFTLRLSDGSSISARSATHLQQVVNSARSLTLLLTRGTAVFDVEPGGPRHWIIEAGLGTIEVTGTRFTVARDERELRVEVERGVVLVRGDRVPDHARRLTAGDSLVVREPVAVAAPPAAARPSPPPLVAPAPLPVAPALARPVRVAAVAPIPPSAAPSWTALAERGDFKAAFDHLGAEGVQKELERLADSPDQLLALADVARNSGHPAEAVTPLRQIISRHRESPSAALAAFTLGKLELDALGHPGAAAAAFADAISLKPPSGLLEAAHARLVEARLRAGDAPGAKAARAEYDKLFPAGQLRQEVDGWQPSVRRE